MFRFDPNQGHNANYVADHIARIEGRHQSKPGLIHDSKWRIASHCNLPNLETKLTPEQEKEVDRLIVDFKVSHAKVIEKYRGVSK